MHDAAGMVRCAARASWALICVSNSGGTGCDASSAACPAGRQRVLPEPRQPGQQDQSQPVALGELRSLYRSIEHDQLLSQHGIQEDQISAATPQV